MSKLSPVTLGIIGMVFVFATWQLFEFAMDTFVFHSSYQPNWIMDICFSVVAGTAVYAFAKKKQSK